MSNKNILFSIHLWHFLISLFIIFSLHCLSPISSVLKNKNLLYKIFHVFLYSKKISVTPHLITLALSYWGMFLLSFTKQWSITVLVSLSKHVFFIHKRFSSIHGTNKLITFVCYIQLKGVLISQHFLHVIIIHYATS